MFRLYFRITAKTLICQLRISVSYCTKLSQTLCIMTICLKTWSNGCLHDIDDDNYYFVKYFGCCIYSLMPVVFQESSFDGWHASVWNKCKIICHGSVFVELLPLGFYPCHMSRVLLFIFLFDWSDAASLLTSMSYISSLGEGEHIWPVTGNRANFLYLRVRWMHVKEK